MGGMAKAIEQGVPKLRIEEAAAKTQARIDAGRQTVVGVNRYRPDHLDDIPMLKVDNSSVREQQLDKLRRLKAERDPAAVESALTALTNGAAGGANLLELAVEAARAKATVGEISLAMEKVFNRHRASIRTIEGVYSKEAGLDNLSVNRARGMVKAFKEAGRAGAKDYGRQDGSGWPRPRPEGDRHRLFRPRVRCGHRPAVPDPRRSGETGGG